MWFSLWNREFSSFRLPKTQFSYFMKNLVWLIICIENSKFNSISCSGFLTNYYFNSFQNLEILYFLKFSNILVNKNMNWFIDIIPLFYSDANFKNYYFLKNINQLIDIIHWCQFSIFCFESWLINWHHSLLSISKLPIFLAKILINYLNLSNSIFENSPIF